MPILNPTTIAGEITALLINPDRDEGMESSAVAAVQASFAGFAGEAHGGLTRPLCSRVTKQYPKGTEIRNTRQISIVSEEELAAVAADMGLPVSLDPAWLGANMVVRCIPAFTLVPPSSRLITTGGVSLVVDMENAPCWQPGDVIEARYPGIGKSYAAKARNRRGVTAWVEREGEVSVGQAVLLHCPPQRAYPPLAT